MKKHMQHALKDIKPDIVHSSGFRSMLIQLEKFFCPEDKQLIESESKNKGEICAWDKLMDTLIRAGDDAFHKFREVLHSEKCFEEAHQKFEDICLDHNIEPYDNLRKPSSDPEFSSQANGSRLQDSTRSNQHHGSTTSWSSFESEDNTPISDFNAREKRERFGSSSSRSGSLGSRDSFQNVTVDDEVKLLHIQARQRICELMNVTNVLNKDWRAVGESIDINSAQFRRLGNIDNPMGQIFQDMEHNRMTIKELVKIFQEIGSKECIKILVQDGHVQGISQGMFLLASLLLELYEIHLEPVRESVTERGNHQEGIKPVQEVEEKKKHVGPIQETEDKYKSNSKSVQEVEDNQKELKSDKKPIQEVEDNQKGFKSDKKPIQEVEDNQKGFKSDKKPIQEVEDNQKGFKSDKKPIQEVEDNQKGFKSDKKPIQEVEDNQKGFKSDKKPIQEVEDNQKECKCDKKPIQEVEDSQKGFKSENKPVQEMESNQREFNNDKPGFVLPIATYDIINKKVNTKTDKDTVMEDAVQCNKSGCCQEIFQDSTVSLKISTSEELGELCLEQCKPKLGELPSDFFKTPVNRVGHQQTNYSLEAAERSQQGKECDKNVREYLSKGSLTQESSVENLAIYPKACEFELDSEIERQSASKCDKFDEREKLTNRTTPSWFESLTHLLGWERRPVFPNRASLECKHHCNTNYDKVIMHAMADNTSDVSKLKQRFAMIICNTNYKQLPQLTPANGCKSLVIQLEKCGWQVESHADTTRSQLLSVVNCFEKTVKNQVAFVFFFGHSVQMKGYNYLLPVDIDKDNLKTACKLNKHACILDAQRQKISSALASVIFIDAGRHLESYRGGFCDIKPINNQCILFGTSKEDRFIADELASVISNEVEYRTLFDLVKPIRNDFMSYSSVSRCYLPISLKAKESTTGDCDIPGLRIPKPDCPKHAFIFNSNVLCDAISNIASQWIVTHSKQAAKLEADFERFVTERTENSNEDAEKICLFYYEGAVAMENGQLFLLPDGISMDEKIEVSWILESLSEAIFGPRVLIINATETRNDTIDASVVKDLILQEVFFAISTKPNSSDDLGQYISHLAKILGQNGIIKRQLTLLSKSFNFDIICNSLFYA
eukprot:gene3067-3531_t